MATLRKALENAKKLNPIALETSLFDIVRRLEVDMTALNREQLFKDSKDVFGNAIGTYSPATAFITGGRKKAGQPYNMFDTGDWQRGFFARVQGDSVLFGTTDGKTEKIFDNPRLKSRDLFGLTEKNLNKIIREQIKPLYLKEIRRILNV